MYWKWAGHSAIDQHSIEVGHNGFKVLLGIIGNMSTIIFSVLVILDNYILPNCAKITFSSFLRIWQCLSTRVTL